MDISSKILTINCSHFPRCPGCRYNDCISPPEIFHEAYHFFQNLGYPIKLYQEDAIHWRTRAKLAVREVDGQVVFGLFQEHSHEIIQIPHCQVHHPILNKALHDLQQAIKKSKITAYDETTGQGLLRYVQVVLERESATVQLTLVLNAVKEPQNIKNCVEELMKNSSLWHSIWLNFNAKKTNVIFGPSWKHVCGKLCVLEKIAGNQIAFGPSHFGQANLSVFEKLLEDLSDQIPKDSQVIELYGGIGVIGLSLSRKARSVLITEREKSAEEYFLLSRSKLSEDVQQRVQFVVSDADEASKLLEKGSVIIVDPPRKGLDKNLIQAICKHDNLHILAYISCNFTSFKKDAERLLEHGWKIDFAKAYLFFPGTNHIELLCIFRKKSG